MTKQWQFRKAEAGLANRIASEPVMFQALVQSMIALVVSFGLGLTAVQVAAILAVTAQACAFWARGKVSPVVQVTPVVVSPPPLP